MSADSASKMAPNTAGSQDRVPGLRRLGDYQILREIGRGGMGVVYEAEQELLGRRVALKVLPLHAAQDERSLERFRREARAAAKLHHTNIVPVFEVGRDGDICFYTMQFISGQPLDVVISELQMLRQPSAKATLPPPDVNLTPANDHTEGYVPLPEPANSAGAARQPTSATMTLPGQMEQSSAAPNPQAHIAFAARVALQVAEALAYAHQRGIIHRDIKPSNLLLDSAGVVWVTDFGLAKADDEGLTGTNEIVGTLRYMAPERFRQQCDARADVYALGLTLYELLALRSAFDAPDQVGMLDQVLHHEPPRLRTRDPRIPRDLETIVLKASDKDPARRYQTADALADDLRHFLADEPIVARQPSSVERLGRWCRRNPLLASLTGAVAALLLCVAVGGTVAAVRMSALAEAEAEARADIQKQADEERRQLERLNRSNTLLENAHRLELQNLWQEALRDHDESVQLRRDNSPAVQGRGRYLLRLGLLDEAARDFARAFELRKPSDPSLWFFHACLRLHQGDEIGYRQVCAAMLQHFQGPADPELARWIVRTCTLAPNALDSPARLVTLAQEVSGSNPNDPGAFRLLRAALLRAGKAQEAFAMPLPKTTLGAVDLSLFALIGHQLNQPNGEARLFEVERSLDQAAWQLLPPSLRPFQNGGVGVRPGPPGLPALYAPGPGQQKQALNDFSPPSGDSIADGLEALLLYREAAVLTGKPGTHPLASLARARSCAVLGRNEDALAALNQASELRPRNPYFVVERARHHLRAKQQAECDKAMRQALALAQLPADRAIFLHAGTFYAAMESWQEAEACLRKIVQRFTLERDLGPLLARVLVAQKKWDEAAPLYARMLDWQELVPVPLPGAAKEQRSFAAILAAEVSAEDELFSRIIVLRPQDDRLWLSRAHWLAEREDWKGTAAVFLQQLDRTELVLRGARLQDTLNPLWTELMRWEPVVERVAEARPKDRTLWFIRGKAAAEKKEFKAAAEHYLKALELIPDGHEFDNERHLIRNWISFHEDVFQRVVDAHPRDDRLWIVRLQVLWSAEKENAPAFIVRMRKHWAGNVDVLTSLAQVLTEGNQFKEAVAIYTELLQGREKDARLRLHLAGLRARLGQWDDALKELLDLLETVPDDPKVSPNRSAVYVALAFHQELFVRATAKRPKDAQLWLSRSQAPEVQRNTVEQTHVLIEALKRDPRNSDVLAMFGRMDLRGQQLDAAAKHFAEALEYAPPKSLFAGRFLYDQTPIHPLHSEVARNEQLFALVSAIRKDDPRLWLERIRLKFNPFVTNFSGFDRAATSEAFNHLVRLAPKEPRAYTERALFYWYHQVREWEKAATDLDAALELIPTEPPWQPEHDWILGPVSFCPEGVYSLLAEKRSARKKPLPAALKLRRAQTFAYQGKQAVEAILQEALREKPKDRGFLLQAARIYGGWQEWDKAVAHLEAARALGDFGDEVGLWFEEAAYLAAAGKKDEHRAHCLRMQNQFKGSVEPVVVNHIALACLLVPDGPGEPKELLNQAELALKANPKLPGYVVAAALARRRVGQSEPAAALIRDLLKANTATAPDLNMMWLVLGMALADQKEAAAARAQLILGLNDLDAGYYQNVPAPFRHQSHSWAATEAIARQARQVLETLLKDVSTLKISDREFIHRRAHADAAHGHWERAADEMAIVWKLGEPGEDSFLWTEAAIYFAAGGKKEEHHAHCVKMLDRFKSGTNPDVLHHVAGSCLLLPEHPGEPKKLLEMAEKARLSDPRIPWYVVTSALALMQGNQDGQAVTLVRDYLKTGELKRFGPQDEVVLRLVFGLALARSKKTAEAREELTTAIKVFDERFPGDKGSATIQEPAHGWATVAVLVHQARPVLKKLMPEK